MAGKAAAKPNLTKCTYCPKKPHSWTLGLSGNHIGNGGILGGRIMEAAHGGGTACDHPFSVTGKRDTAQAHHLICSEAMRSDKNWANICASFGYDINGIKNGVFLPGNMKVACQLEIPLHKSSHNATLTNMPSNNYVKGVKKKIKPIKNKAMGFLPPNYCKKPTEINEDLNSVSASIWRLVKKFSWTLTKDGRNYKPGSKIGCSGFRSLSQFDTNNVGKITNAKHCSNNRQHYKNLLVAKNLPQLSK